MRNKFVAEGKVAVGPSARHFVYLEGEYLGQRLVDHFGLPEERGYADLGRDRITVERLDEPRAETVICPSPLVCATPL